MPIPPGLAAETVDYLTNTIYNAVIPSAEDCKSDTTVKVSTLNTLPTRPDCERCRACGRNSGIKAPCCNRKFNFIGVPADYGNLLVDLCRRFRARKHQPVSDSALLSNTDTENDNIF